MISIARAILPMADIDPLLAFMSLDAQKRRPRNAARRRRQAQQNTRDVIAQTRRSADLRKRELLSLYFPPIAGVRLTKELLAALHVQTNADVALYANLGRHSNERHPEQAQEVLAALPLTFDKLLFVDDLDKDPKPGRLQFVLYFQHGPHHYLRVPLKIIRSATPIGKDQCWLGTAFKLNPANLGKRKSHLRPIIGNARNIGKVIIPVDLKIGGGWGLSRPGCLAMLDSPS
jgi:hypothetical protein